MPMSQFEYIVEGGFLCPFCGKSDDIEMQWISTQGGYIKQGCQCDNCGREWYNLYLLIAYRYQEDEV